MRLSYAFAATALAASLCCARALAQPGQDVSEEQGFPRLELGARVMTGFRYALEKPRAIQGGFRDQQQEFFLKQARVGVDAELNDSIDAELSLELSDAIDPKFSALDAKHPAFIRDASIDVKFAREFRLRAGRFKRPMSALQIASRAKLSIADRGLLNDLLIEDNEWGDRAIGAMLWGKVRWAKLRWRLAVTEAVWSAAVRREGFDVLGRVELSPLKVLTFGLGGGRKSLEFADERFTGNGAGADVQLHLGDFRLLVEGLMAERLLDADQPAAFGALLLTSYEFPLSSRWRAQPALFLEFADANSEITQTEAFRSVVGFNWILDEQLRFMPHVGFTQPLGTVSAFNPWETSYEYSLLLSLDL